MISHRPDEFTLTTGKTISANLNIIGIDIHGNLFEGYDGRFSMDDLTTEEKIEILEHLISESFRLKKAYEQGVPIEPKN